jgi:hypothetical protein
MSEAQSKPENRVATPEQDQWVQNALHYDVRQWLDLAEPAPPEVLLASARNRLRELDGRLAAAPQADVAAARTAKATAQGVREALSSDAPSQRALLGARQQLDVLERQVGEAITAMAEARATQTRLREQATKLDPPPEAEAEADKDALGELKKAREEIDNWLRGEVPRDQDLTQAEGRIGEAQGTIRAIVEAASKRAQDVEKTRESVRKRREALGNAGTAPEVVAAALEAADKVDEALADKQPGVALAAAREPLETFEKEAKAAEELITTLRARMEKVEERRQAATEANALDTAKEAIALADAAVAKALKAPLSEPACVEAERLAGELETAVQAARDELADLGGPEGAGALAVAFGKNGLKDADAALGGRANVRKLAKAFGATALVGLCQRLGANDAVAGGNAVAALAEHFAPNALLQAETEMGGANLAGLLSAAGGDGAKVKTALDALGGPTAAAFMQGGAGADAPLKLAASVSDGGKALRTLVAESGLAGKPKALAGLFARGCGGDAAEFARLCDGFADAKDRAALKGLIEGGGLGDAPDALAELIRTGDGKIDVAPLKALGTACADKDSRDGLARLLGDGGLGGKDADPRCLAEILARGHKDPNATGAEKAQGLAALCKGLSKTDCQAFATLAGEGGLGKQPKVLGSLIGGFCGGEAAKLNDLSGAFADKGAREGLARLLDKGKLGDAVGNPACLAEIAGRIDPASTATVAGKSGKLAALCKGLSESDCAKLGGMVADGGLGAEPKVLGELIGRGCKGDATKVSDLAKAFPGKTENDGLKAALAKGGLGTTDDTGNATNTDPKCLANLLDPGCKAKGATDLAKLLTSLNDTDRTALKDVMVTGKLGTRPEVLGNLYGTGCQQDPTDPSKGQNPAVFKKLMETFSVAKDAQGPDKFDKLLDRGGLADKPEWLGKIVRDAFTEKAANSVQQPEKLMELYNAFMPGSVDKLNDLKTIVTAIDATPPNIGPSGEPGRGLQNLLRRKPPATRLAIADLQTRFFTGLDARATLTSGLGAPPTVGGVPWLSRDELIQNAVTFEGAPASVGVQVIGGYNANVDHVSTRHTRECQDFNVHNPYGGNPKPTTLFPTTVKEADIQNIMTQALADVSRPKAKKTPIVGNLAANHPPRNINDLSPPNPRGQQYEPCTGGGYPCLVGFGWSGPVGSGRVEYKQLYPLAGGGTVTIAGADMLVMKAAINL